MIARCRPVQQRLTRMRRRLVRAVGSATLPNPAVQRWRSVRQLVKGILRRIAPQWTMSLLSARARVQSHRCVALWGSGPVVDKLIGRFGNRVREGLFAGL